MTSFPYQDPVLPVSARIDDLLSRMTLAEKVAQLCTTSGFRMYEIGPGGEIRFTKALDDLYAKFPGCGLSSFFRADWFSGRNWDTGLKPEMMVRAHNALQRYAIENTRLGIPLAIGCGQMLGQTTLPCGLGCAATFDIGAITAGTRMKLAEFRTATRSFGIGHPTCDLALDPRWSRVEQTFGEDPFLSAEINFARCRAAREMGGGASLAHFVAHGCGEGGRMSMPVHVGDNELLNLHLRPFEYAVKGGATGVMTCYNLVDGVPGVLRGDLINGFLRGKLGYRGTFTADAGAIGALVWQGFARDLGEAAALAVKNGNDLCCWEAENYLNGLMLALERGLVNEAEIDRSVRRVLESKFRRGLFEHPYIDEEWSAKYGKPEEVIGCRVHRDTALDLARKAMTLLENPHGVLPLDAAKVHRLAVIGPNADKPANQLGDYTAPQRPGQTVTPRMGFEVLGKRLGFEVVYAKGCAVRSRDKSGFAEALAVAKSSDAVVLCLGGCSVADRPLRQNAAGTAIAGGDAQDGDLPDKDAGEGFDRATLRLGGVQLDLLREIRALGKPVVTVLILGRPLVLDEVAALSDAILLAWYPGCEGGTAIAETVFGLNNPGGKLPVSFPRGEGAIPCFYHYLMPRGNYVDAPCAPLWWFGHGLSYTAFEVSVPSIDGDTVRATVKNTGARAGDDVIQMYLRDVVATVARPRWELKGFCRISLAPGEKKVVAFPITEKELGYWNRDREYVVEDGEFWIAVSDRFEPEKWLDGDAPTERVARYARG
jgi:beta-glucosidase